VSDLSVSDYFPWKRVKVASQAVHVELRSALVRIEPDQRYWPLCGECGGPARTVHSHSRRFIRDLSFADFEMLLQVEHRKVWCDACGGVRVERHSGGRSELRSLFELAEDSTTELDSYIEEGEVHVAVVGDRIVGHLQLVDTAGTLRSEIRNMAVEPGYRRRGIGNRLLGTAAEIARARGKTQLVVATAAADVDNLRFYQRAGFRLRSIERDAFTPAAGYTPGTVIDGIDLRDRVWLDLDLRASGRAA